MQKDIILTILSANLKAHIREAQTKANESDTTQIVFVDKNQQMGFISEKNFGDLNLQLHKLATCHPESNPVQTITFERTFFNRIFLKAIEGATDYANKKGIIQYVYLNNAGLMDYTENDFAAPGFIQICSINPEKINLKSDKKLVVAFAPGFMNFTGDPAAPSEYDWAKTRAQVLEQLHESPHRSKMEKSADVFILRNIQLDYFSKIKDSAEFKRFLRHILSDFASEQIADLLGEPESAPKIEGTPADLFFDNPGDLKNFCDDRPATKCTCAYCGKRITDPDALHGSQNSNCFCGLDCSFSFDRIKQGKQNASELASDQLVTLHFHLWERVDKNDFIDDIDRYYLTRLKDEIEAEMRERGRNVLQLIEVNFESKDRTQTDGDGAANAQGLGEDCDECDSLLPGDKSKIIRLVLNDETYQFGSLECLRDNVQREIKNHNPTIDKDDDPQYLSAVEDLRNSKEDIFKSAIDFCSLKGLNFMENYPELLTTFALQEIAEFCGLDLGTPELKLSKPAAKSSDAERAAILDIIDERLARRQALDDCPDVLAKVEKLLQQNIEFSRDRLQLDNRSIPTVVERFVFQMRLENKDVIWDDLKATFRDLLLFARHEMSGKAQRAKSISKTDAAQNDASIDPNSPHALKAVGYCTNCSSPIGDNFHENLDDEKFCTEKCLNEYETKFNSGSLENMVLIEQNRPKQIAVSFDPDSATRDKIRELAKMYYSRRYRENSIFNIAELMSSFFIDHVDIFRPKTINPENLYLPKFYRERLEALTRETENLDKIKRESEKHREEMIDQMKDVNRQIKKLVSVPGVGACDYCKKPLDPNPANNQRLINAHAATNFFCSSDCLCNFDNTARQCSKCSKRFVGGAIMDTKNTFCTKHCQDVFYLGEPGSAGRRKFNEENK